MGVAHLWNERRRGRWFCTFVIFAALLSDTLPVKAEVPDPAIAVWGNWQPFDASAVERPVGRPAVIRDASNRLQVFVRVAAPLTVSAHDTLMRIRQSGKANPAWQPWTPLGGPGGVIGDPVVGKNADGRLEVFCRGRDGEIKHIWQTDTTQDTWSNWETLGSGNPRLNAVGNPAVGANFDGRLDVFVAAGTPAGGFTLHHIWQSKTPGAANWTWPPNGQWEDLGGHLSGSPMVGTNGDGRLEVFVRSTANELEHLSQIVESRLIDGALVDRGWTGWGVLGTGGLAGDPAVGVNVDGRLEVFVRKASNGVWHTWQMSASHIPRGLVNTVVAWSPWERLPATAAANNQGIPVEPVVAGDPVVGVDLDGRLEVFVRAASPVGSLWHSRQQDSRTSIPSWWSYWENTQGQLSADPALGTNWDGRLEAFAFAIDHRVYHLWQQPAIQWVLGSTMRKPMGHGNPTPDDGDRIPDGDLGQSVMHDGKLYFFLDDGVATDRNGTPNYADPIGVMTPSGGAAEGFQGMDLAADRDASRDFSALKFHFKTPGNAFSSLFQLNTPLGPKTIGQNQGAGGGFSFDGKVFVFGYVRFLDPPPNTAPHWIPAPNLDLPSTGHSILSSAVNPWGPYDLQLAMGPRGEVRTGKFNQVAPVLVKNAEIPLLPRTDANGSTAEDGLIMLGQGGDPGDPAGGVYVAWMPLRRGAPPYASNLQFYKGNDHPLPHDPPGKFWSTDPHHAKLLFETRYFWSSISMGRIRSSGKWIMLYQKTADDTGNPKPELRHDGIYARIGRTPWDWSPEVKIFDPDREHAWGDYIRDEEGAFPYGAALLNPYTNWDAATHTVTIQYLLSTQHPYGVVLMQSQIQVNN